MEYTEEEKKAIEEAKNQIVECDNLDNLNCFLTDSTTLKILLDLIEKLQKEIDRLDEQCENQAEFIEKIQDNIGHKGMTKKELVFMCASLEWDNKELDEELENSISKEAIREKLYKCKVFVPEYMCEMIPTEYIELLLGE